MCHVFISVLSLLLSAAEHMLHLHWCSPSTHCPSPLHHPHTVTQQHRELVNNRHLCVHILLSDKIRRNTSKWKWKHVMFFSVGIKKACKCLLWVDLNKNKKETTKKLTEKVLSIVYGPEWGCVVLNVEVGDFLFSYTFLQFFFLNLLSPFCCFFFNLFSSITPANQLCTVCPFPTMHPRQQTAPIHNLAQHGFRSCWEL